MNTARKAKLKTLSCPRCDEMGTLRKIIYGMPDPETFDFEKYAVGGCCVSPNQRDPDVKCRVCDWSGFSEALRQ